MNQNNSFLTRYQRGELIEVWNELRELEDRVQKPENLDEAMEVARETMRRVRINVEMVYDHLRKLEYQFEYPDEVFVAPDPNVQSILAEIEETVGQLPLSLKAFYMEVGSVNFIQSWNQIIHYYKPERQTASELYILGEEDPLVVGPVSRLLTDIYSEEWAQEYCFAPDEFHKANYSGGENYHVSLPNPSADFRIQGMYGVNEYFVDYLRATFRYGGFRGKIDTADTLSGKKLPPSIQIIEKLAYNLLLF